MEKMIPCASTTDQMIKDMSEVLLEIGVTDGANYYESDEYRVPYFKIAKPFKKETEDDPDFWYIYVDVDENEYTVHGRFIHEHFGGANRAAMLVAELLTGSTVEVALVFPDRMAGFFMQNTGDPAKNVKVIDDNADTIMKHLNSPMATMPNVHGHVLFSPAFPYYLYYGGGRQPQIEGVTIYLLSSVCGEHTEYYVIQ